MKYIYNILLCSLLALVATNGFGQELSREARRYEIDVKRLDLNFDDREALFRSREFIRLDPSYYVGHMFEALFKYNRASDYVGFRNAVPILKKSIQLLESDFANELKLQYKGKEDYAPVEKVRLDYLYLTNALMDCYSNLEQPDSVYLLLNHYKSWNFQRDMLHADTYLAWTFHRNRFYTTDRYSFLGKTIKENDDTAFNYLYQAKAAIEKNRNLNENVFGSMQILGDELSIAHYLALIHSYERNTDSAYYYYRQMEGYNIFPYNNFGIFNFTNGDFYQAENFFRYALWYDYGDKRIKESEYYMGILAIFRGNPEEAISRHKEQLKSMGVIPGWGWINLALARGYLYNGQLDKCNDHLKKARNFKELHIGSTWTQNHYDVSGNTLELVRKDREQAALKFEDKSYWLSPVNLAKLIQLKVEKSTQQLLLINNLSTNPEREEVFYSIFSSENTVSFDEVWYMIKDYGQNFFIKKFRELEKTDDRERIKKYFKLFTAKLLVEKGKKEEAAQILRRILKEDSIDTEFEILFKARVYEALAQCSGKEEDIYSFYELFPQLVPFSELTMSFKLQVLGDEKSKTKTDVLRLLKRYKIDWVSESNNNAPTVSLYFSNDGSKDVVTYSVKLAGGKSVVRNTDLSAPTAEELTKQLVYGFFKITDPKESEGDFY